MRSTDAKQSAEKGGFWVVGWCFLGWVIHGAGRQFMVIIVALFAAGACVCLYLRQIVGPGPPKKRRKNNKNPTQKPIPHLPTPPCPFPQFPPRKQMKPKTRKAKSAKLTADREMAKKHLLRQCKLADMCVCHKYEHWHAQLGSLKY